MTNAGGLATDSDDLEIQPIRRWFAERRFGMKLTEREGGLVCAALTRSSGDVVASMFGHGDTPLVAAQRVKQRYERERERTPKGEVDLSRG